MRNRIARRAAGFVLLALCAAPNIATAEQSVTAGPVLSQSRSNDGPLDRALKGGLRGALIGGAVGGVVGLIAYALKKGKNDKK